MSDCPTCHGRRCAVSIIPAGCAFYYGHPGYHLTRQEAEGYRTECPTCSPVPTLERREENDA